MGKKRIYVTRMIPREGIDLLEGEFEVIVNPEDRPLKCKEFLNNIKSADGVISQLTDRIDEEVFRTAPNVKGFANYAVGYDNVDVKKAVEYGIPVSNTPDVLTAATAEMAWALLFAVARRVVESDFVMRNGKWEGWAPTQFLGGEVSSKTLGVVGAGRIGTAMALMSKGFGMKVLYTGNRVNQVLEEQLGAEKVDFSYLLENSDFISIHTPLNKNTVHLFGLKEFKMMKKSAFLVNTSRGPVINEEDLVTALREGIIAGAGIDVYEKEPEAHPGLAGLKNVVMTPHTGSATYNARTGMAKKAAANMAAMMRGERATDCINPEVYDSKLVD